MIRVSEEPRRKYKESIREQGLVFEGEHPYWLEDRAYLFPADEIDEIEAATNDLHQLFLLGVAHLVKTGTLGRVGIPEAFQGLVADSWRRGDRSLYGRFDLAYCGKDAGPPKCLEYNADTPTSLVEAAIIQHHWFLDRYPDRDQFNSIHETLVEQWKEIRVGDGVDELHFMHADDSEDNATVGYLRDTAEAAGIRTHAHWLEEVRYNAGDPRYLVEISGREREIAALFKLWPWEHIFLEVQTSLPTVVDHTRFYEPMWKAALSSKAMLAVLWELFPGHPNLLPAYFSADPFAREAGFVEKPFFSREGSNVRIIANGDTVAVNGGPYSGAKVYQQRASLFEAKSACVTTYAILGSWVVGGKACGMGIREGRDLITTNTTPFVPHFFV